MLDSQCRLGIDYVLMQSYLLHWVRLEQWDPSSLETLRPLIAPRDAADAAVQGL